MGTLAIFGTNHAHTTETGANLQNLVVIVPPLNSPDEHAVDKLKAHVLARHPGAVIWNPLADFERVTESWQVIEAIRHVRDAVRHVGRAYIGKERDGAGFTQDVLAACIGTGAEVVNMNELHH